MSRLGKKPIAIPDNASVEVADGVVEVSADGNSLTRPVPESVSVEVTDDGIVTGPADDSKEAQSMWGTFASHLINMLTGVTDGFEKVLEFSGIGYRANVSGGSLNLEMGYSHDVELDIPDELEVSCENQEITVSGADKDAVGQFAATVRSVREPEPYKGSGIKYKDETIIRKEGKRAV